MIENHEVSLSWILELFDCIFNKNFIKASHTNSSVFLEKQDLTGGEGINWDGVSFMHNHCWTMRTAHSLYDFFSIPFYSI